jgi:dihydrofolate synthase/folylpolyglutamate synthase
MEINTELGYLNSLGLHDVKPGLKRISTILDYLGNPQDKFRSIIVGGTNGKGSVSSIISSVLINNGYNTGLYTSPHLVEVNERISLNNLPISISDLSFLIRKLRNICAEQDIRPSYFEFLTALAFIYFYEKKIDICILEVGMGGRWDATNIVTPLISIITNISFDHMDYLGNTLYEIGQEKAEVIKNSIPVVTACSIDTIKPISSKANISSAPLYRYGIEFNSKGNCPDKFDYKSKTTELLNLQSNLTGSYQIENLSVALQAIEILRIKYNFKLSEHFIRNGLQNVKCNGRLEILDSKKPVILDCAHNDSSSKALIESLKILYPDTKFCFLIGMLRDKDHKTFIENISELSDTIFITDQFSERETSADKLKSLCEQLNCKYEVIINYEIAYKTLIEKDLPLCITGSIYLVGQIKELLLEYNSRLNTG